MTITDTVLERIAGEHRLMDEALTALQVFRLSRFLDPIHGNAEVLRCLTALRRAVNEGRDTADIEADLQTVDQVLSIAGRKPYRPSLGSHKDAAVALALAVGDRDPWPEDKFAGDGSMTEDEIEAASLAVRMWWNSWHDELRAAVMASCPGILDWRRGTRQLIAVLCRGRYVAVTVCDGCVVAVEAHANIQRWAELEDELDDGEGHW